MQGVRRETLQLFGVRLSCDGRGLVLPVYSFTGTLVGVKVIAVRDDSDSTKTHVTTRTIPRCSNLLVLVHVQVLVLDLSGPTSPQFGLTTFF